MHIMKLASELNLRRSNYFVILDSFTTYIHYKKILEDIVDG